MLGGRTYEWGRFAWGAADTDCIVVVKGGGEMSVETALRGGTLMRRADLRTFLSTLPLHMYPCIGTVAGSRDPRFVHTRALCTNALCAHREIPDGAAEGYLRLF